MQNRGGWVSLWIPPKRCMWFNRDIWFLLWKKIVPIRLILLDFGGLWSSVKNLILETKTVRLGGGITPHILQSFRDKATNQRPNTVVTAVRRFTVDLLHLRELRLKVGGGSSLGSQNKSRVLEENAGFIKNLDFYLLLYLFDFPFFDSTPNLNPPKNPQGLEVVGLRMGIGICF